MTLKSMLLFRAAMTKRGEKGTLTGDPYNVRTGVVKRDQNNSKS